MEDTERERMEQRQRKVERRADALRQRTTAVPTESREDGSSPEDVPRELRQAHQRPHTHPVHLLERVEHRHVASPPHLGRVHHAACNHTVM